MCLFNFLCLFTFAYFICFIATTEITQQLAILCLLLKSLQAKLIRALLNFVTLTPGFQLQI